MSWPRRCARIKVPEDGVSSGGIDRDRGQQALLFEIIVTGTQFVPKRSVDGVRLRKHVPRCRRHARGENVDRNVTLTTAMRVERHQEELFHCGVAQRKTADGAIAAVNEDFTARLVRIRTDPVGSIRIIDPEREMIEALRIETVDEVKTLRHLSVAFPPFRTGSAGGCDDRPGADVMERARLFTRPKFEFPFVLESTEKNFPRRIRQLSAAQAGTNFFLARRTRLSNTSGAFTAQIRRMAFDSSPDERETRGGREDEEEASANHRVCNLRCQGRCAHENLPR